jgi:hypothetical protein
VKLLIYIYSKEIQDKAINVHCFKRGKRGKSCNHRHVFKVKYKCERTALNIWLDLQNKATQAFKEALIQCNYNPEMQTYNIFTQVKKKNARREVAFYQAKEQMRWNGHTDSSRRCFVSMPKPWDQRHARC